MKKSYSFIVLFFVIIVASCTLNNSGQISTQASTFLVAQYSPDAPKLGVFVSGSPFDTGLELGTPSPYTTVSSGTYTFDVRVSDSANIVLTKAITLTANHIYSYFLIDSFKKLQSVIVNDVFTKTTADSAYVRFFNFCPNTSLVLSLVDSVSKASYFANRTFNDQAVNPAYATFNELPAIAHTFYLMNGIDTLVKQAITFTRGNVYTLIAKGLINTTDTTEKISVNQLINYP